MNPTTLTAAGGVLASGTENVMIQCNNCTDDDGAVIDTVRWYDPDGNRLISPLHSQFDPNFPHFKRVDGDNSNIILIFPTFSGSYDGIYICGRLANTVAALEPPTAAVTLNGELTQSVVCVYIIV